MSGVASASPFPPTAINTVPGLLVHAGGRPKLGAGPGGTSGPGIFPVGLAAVKKIVAAVSVPVLGVGGIVSGREARAYLEAGASLVQVGTGSFADPRCAARVAQQVGQGPFAIDSSAA